MATDGGFIVSTKWTQSAGPLVGLDGNNALETSFVAPDVSETTILSFTLSATDNSDASSSDIVDITIIPINKKPTAIAGADIQLLSGERAVLDGNASFDTDGYQWSVLNDQALDIDNATSGMTSFTAPAVISNTTFVVSLVVTDNQGAVDISLIEVEVSPNADLPALSSIALTKLNNTIVVVKGTDANNRHTTLALLLADPTQTESEARVYIASEVFDEVTSEIRTLATEASLNWYTQNNNLIIESDVFGSQAIEFTDGIINLEDAIPNLGQIKDAVTNEGALNNINAKVSGLYKRNRLVTDNLTGYRFTILKNGKNSLIDFVSNTYAFMYEEGNLEIQSINWSYTLNDQGEKEIRLEIEPNSPVIENHASFASWDTIDADIIIDIAVLPPIDKPLAEVAFNDANLAACVADAARSNNWLSVNDVKHLDCSSLNISSAVGIEKLSALTTLNLSANTLVNIDLSQFTQLSMLDLSNNNLISINFTNNPLLDIVYLSNNNLSNATIAYLSSISWIDSLGFDSAAVLPNGSDFVIRVTLEQQEFTLFTNPSFDYDYTVDWGDGTVNSNYSEDAVHTYTQDGEYEITISGQYPALKFCEDNDGCSSFKIDVLQWGANSWLSMRQAFSGLSKLNILASDAPNLSQVRDLSFMFYKASNFNSDISKWDISTATSMEFMFGLASGFNGDISQWNTSNVTNMGGLFYLASSFNGDISQWDTSSVTAMQSLFAFATDFNSDISQWDTSSVTQMATMFLEATNFNSDLSLWDTALVENMNKMFFNATSMSGNLSSWQVSQSLRRKDFTHEGSLLIEPIWKN
jgi:surface protein